MKKRIFVYILGITILLESIYLIKLYREWKTWKPKKEEEKKQEKTLYLSSQKEQKEEIPLLIANSIHEYEVHLKKNPNDVQTHLTLGQICLTIASRQEQAGRHLKKVLELSPEHPKKKNIQEWLEKLKQRENRKKLEEKEHIHKK